MIKTTLKIDGMMCNMCESHVNDAVRREFSVKKVSSSHSSGTTEIISEEALDEGKLKSVIEETGYKVLSSQSEPYEKKGFSFFKK
ncbi:MAG: heavy-metal-associated domain-containing protein [Ruminococcus sp.]|nr:heavy-metal-associated domain-containing protein [Ruminococcus sp.]